MPTISARISAVALVIAALCPPQAAMALGLRFGPFRLSLPVPHYRYHGRRIVRSEPTAGMARTELGDPAGTMGSEPTENGSPSLLYPVLAWPSLYDNIFWPRNAEPWTFGYENIFGQAFAKYSAQRASAFCPYRISTDEVVTRIARETMPTAAQKPLLQQLATSLGQANGYLVKSCPREIPAQPVARLQLMENQIDAMIMALDIVRPQLQAFEQSLDDKQRARLNGSPPPAGGGAIPACKLSAGAVNGPLSQLEQAVQPTDAQRPALGAVTDAFNRAAAALDANCSNVTPPTALGRLEAIETRLDASGAPRDDPSGAGEFSGAAERRAEHAVQRAGNRQHAVRRLRPGILLLFNAQLANRQFIDFQRLEARLLDRQAADRDLTDRQRTDSHRTERDGSHRECQQATRREGVSSPRYITCRIACHVACHG